MVSVSQLYDIFLRHPQVTTDSRDCPAGSIFFALKGDSFDGNRFAAVALEKGCAYAVVDDATCVVDGDDRYLLVDDVLTTLQALAHEHRLHFRGTVLEITGTNGKTTTKELVSAVLSRKYDVLFTQGNFNNHIGVPKTLLRLAGHHEIAVVETGANHPGEIKTLASIVAPDCGLITNVGIGHIEGFGSFEGVVRTKGELYDNLRANPRGFIFLNADNGHLRAIASGLRAVTYGRPGNGYDVEGELMECAPFLKFRWRSGVAATSADWHEVQMQIVGSYNLDNALAAVCVGLHFGVAPSEVDKALSGYVPTNNRSELRRTDRNSLIVDAYNANPSSMTAAIDNFAFITPPDGMEKMLILGDMGELGSVSDSEHHNIVNLLVQKGFTNVWLVGDNFRRCNPPFETFIDVDEVIARIRSESLSGRLILIKGSNFTHLYRLPEVL